MPKMAFKVFFELSNFLLCCFQMDSYENISKLKQLMYFAKHIDNPVLHHTSQTDNFFIDLICFLSYEGIYHKYRQVH